MIFFLILLSLTRPLPVRAKQLTKEDSLDRTYLLIMSSHMRMKNLSKLMSSS
jgi:hypothetical protein